MPVTGPDAWRCKRGRHARPAIRTEAENARTAAVWADLMRPAIQPKQNDELRMTNDELKHTP
jgi:hypothetical protein